jgi:hypothetical protein
MSVSANACPRLEPAPEAPGVVSKIARPTVSTAILEMGIRPPLTAVYAERFIRVIADLQKLHCFRYFAEFGEEVLRFCFALSRR